jgi:catechol 2,3-dioxygenase-like lactoylglutathione lyase family enzyme
LKAWVCNPLVYGFQLKRADYSCAGNKRKVAEAHIQQSFASKAKDVLYESDSGLILSSHYFIGYPKGEKMDSIKGLHHVTVVARDPQRNVDFYRNVLWQRLVKKTVNFDVPDTYHFYFADEIGTPGSVMTFFAWPNTRQGTRGNGETAAVAYNVPPGSLDFWQGHLKKNGIKTEPVEKDSAKMFFLLTIPMACV